VAVLGTYARLLGDAEDSPIVDDVGDANQFFGGALINYRF
jgi:outer membrane scaffolding protein for murein synthesis (MipA/OmpV family)